MPSTQFKYSGARDLVVPRIPMALFGELLNAGASLFSTVSEQFALFLEEEAQEEEEQLRSQPFPSGTHLPSHQLLSSLPSSSPSSSHSSHSSPPSCSCACAASFDYALSPFITEFASALAEHEATFVDFPACDCGLPSEAFHLTPPQLVHARLVLLASPAFARLRLELCPASITERELWRVYFTLLSHQTTRVRELGPCPDVQRGGVRCGGEADSPAQRSPRRVDEANVAAWRLVDAVVGDLVQRARLLQASRLLNDSVSSDLCSSPIARHIPAHPLTLTPSLDRSFRLSSPLLFSPHASALPTPHRPPR